MRAFVMVGVVVATGLGMWGCGSGYGNGSSGSPSSPTPPTAPDLVTVNVVGINGALSFSPNPATLPAGQTIIWHNVDSVTHHVVFNDGSVDTVTSQDKTTNRAALSLPASGIQYT